MLISSAKILIKIFEVEKEISAHSYEPGYFLTDDKTFIKIATRDGFLKVLKLQLPGKKRMGTEELLRGYSFKN